MTAELRIIGQGIAGSLLGWACDRAGISFIIEDCFTDAAPIVSASASSVGAGIINPITGQRLVKSWRVDSLLPIAVAMYQEIGDILGQSFLFPYRLRRFFADDRERAVARAKWARGEFADFGQNLDDEGLWVEPAYRVDVHGLVQALRARWRKMGHWRESDAPLPISGGQTALTVRCIGASELADDAFSWASLAPAKGELLEIETAPGALDPKVILNRHEWIVPLNDSRALVGATVEPGIAASGPTAHARAILEKAAAQLLGDVPFRTVFHRAGVRVVAPDKHPVIGRHPENASLGLFNALGSKGALLAPWLANEWVAHLQTGRPIDSTVAITRFWH